MSVFDKTSFKRYTLNVINKVGGFYPWLKKNLHLLVPHVVLVTIQKQLVIHNVLSV